MKRIVSGMLAIFAIFAFSSQAFAQEEQYFRRPHRVHIYIESGIGIPAKPGIFKEYWNTTVPFTLGAGYPVFGWLYVGGGFTYGKFTVDALQAKGTIGYVGTAEATGGAVTMTGYWGSARFLAVPSQRINPFFEVALGVFNATAEDLEIDTTDESSQVNSPGGINRMKDVSGTMVNFGGGIQYALNPYWSAYARYFYQVNLNGEFGPSNLIRPFDEEPGMGDGDMQYSAIIIGIMLRI